LYRQLFGACCILVKAKNLGKLVQILKLRVINELNSMLNSEYIARWADYSLCMDTKFFRLKGGWPSVIPYRQR